MGVELPGSRVLVTGASSGIGASIARELASAGATVGICARRSDLLAGVLADCRRDVPACRAWTVDLADLDGIDAFARLVEAELGGVDVLVNNAGVVAAARLPDVDYAGVESLMAINFLSPVRLTLALLPGMLERGSGAVLTISSVAARLAPPTESAYAATKAAITAYFEAAAADLWYRGVRIQLMFPGMIRVNDDPPDALHAGMEATPADDVARAVRAQLESGALEAYVPGHFADLYAHRSRDVEGFVAASAAFAEERIAGG